MKLNETKCELLTSNLVILYHRHKGLHRNHLFMCQFSTCSYYFWSYMCELSL